MSLSIHLLPEFGWSTRGRQLIGPGSVFQGRVELRLSKPITMDRLRLVFRAHESLVPYDIAPGIIRSKSSSLFSVQQVLWDCSDNHGSCNTGNYTYPFTIQMPMVQYPPSTANNIYNCTFKLIALVESQQQQRQQQYETVMMTDLEMLYMPFVETSLLKQPLITNQHELGIHVTTKLHSLSYVPGDSILGSITIGTKSSTSKKQLHVSLSLYQTTSNLFFKDVPESTQLIMSTSLKLSPVNRNSNNDSNNNNSSSSSSSSSSSNSSNTTYSASLELDLPADITPTFTYSKLSSITYRLCLSVKRKWPLSIIWNQALEMDWPLTIGTLGAGVHSSSDLTIYNAIENTNAIEPLTPKFMKAVEYEHALPVYEPSQLPDYQDCNDYGDVPFDLV